MSLLKSMALEDDFGAATPVPASAKAPKTIAVLKNRNILSHFAKKIPIQMPVPQALVFIY